MIVKNFGDIENYLRENGLKSKDFFVDLSINTVELFANETNEYFISVGEYDNNTFEVFARSVGAKWDNDGFCIEDGKLIQYKIFKRLKKAIDFALKCRNNGKLPEKYIKVW